MGNFTLHVSRNHWEEKWLIELDEAYVYHPSRRLVDLWIEGQLQEGQGQSNQAIYVFSDQELSFTQLISHSMSKEQLIIYELADDYTDGELNLILSWEKQGKLLLINRQLAPDEKLSLVKAWIKSRPIKQRKNIISFLSPISNVGLTFVTLLIAKMLASQTKLKIGVLSLNLWEDSTSFIQDYSGKYLDEIKNIVQHGLFHDQEFLSLFHQEAPNLYILAGNRQIRLERQYTLAEIKQLIDAADKCFDLVLIDAGCHYDNAALFAALHAAETKVLVTNQQIKAWKKFDQQFEQILSQLGYSRKDFWLMINQFQQQTELPTSKDLIKRYDLPYLCTLPYISNHAIAQEIMLNEELLESSGVQQGIQVAVKSIAHEQNLLAYFHTVQAPTRKRWATSIFNRLGGEKVGGA